MRNSTGENFSEKQRTCCWAWRSSARAGGGAAVGRGGGVEPGPGGAAPGPRGGAAPGQGEETLGVE